MIFGYLVVKRALADVLWTVSGRPHSVDFDRLSAELSALTGVRSVHSLKVWALTSNELCASVHLAVGMCMYAYGLAR